MPPKKNRKRTHAQEIDDLFRPPLNLKRVNKPKFPDHVDGAK